MSDLDRARWRIYHGTKYPERYGREVRILRPLRPTENPIHPLPAFLVRFEDGFEITVALDDVPERSR